MEKKYAFDVFGVKKHKGVLSNGLQYIFIEKPHAPIYARILMRAGSIFNNEDNGLAHFTEHMLVSASEKYPRFELIEGIIRNVGGYAGAFTSLEEMGVECKIALPEHLHLMKEYFSEVLGDIFITPTLFEKERNVIISEIARKLSRSSRYTIARYFKNALSGGTPWEHSNLGTQETVSSLTPDMVAGFFRHNCTVPNMRLIVSGGCNLSDIAGTFGTLALLNGDTENILPADPEKLSPNSKIFYEHDSPEADIEFLFDGPELYTRESLVHRFALQFANNGPCSPFFITLRNERGLAYDLSYCAEIFKRLKYCGTSIGVPNEKVDETIEALIECYESFRNTGMTKKDIQDSIDRMYFADRKNLETSLDWVKTFQEDFLYPSEKRIIGDYPDAFSFFNTITPEEVSDVLQKYITLENFHLLIDGKSPGGKYF